MNEASVQASGPPADPGRHVKVLRLRILKPADQLKWAELDKLLRDVRYRVFRLANLAVSENYLNYHIWRTGCNSEFKRQTIGALSKRLREMLVAENVPAEELARFAKSGAVVSAVSDALSAYKIRAITNPSKWRDVVRGKAALPTFRLNMAIPVRCDKPGMRRMTRSGERDVHLDLQICTKPYPRVVLQTGDIGDGARAVLDRLLDNQTNGLGGYRQRLFEIKHDDRDNKWWLYITYDFPKLPPAQINPDVIVGVDLGVTCPAYVALSNGHARLGRRHFQGLGARIRSLQRQTVARRREMLQGGKSQLVRDTARSGHGVTRRIRPIEKLEGRINSAYNTLNHQLSAAIVEFARTHGAGVIQMEDLTGMRDELRGTFLGGSWRYHQLQEFLKYKANEAGIEIQRVNPRYTSRRCSACGHLHLAFDRRARDASRRAGFVARFECPMCKKTMDPDYNAARNLATADIAALIDKQYAVQCQSLSENEQIEAAAKTTLAPRGNRGSAAEGRPARPDG